MHGSGYRHPRQGEALQNKLESDQCRGKEGATEEVMRQTSSVTVMAGINYFNEPLDKGQEGM